MKRKLSVRVLASVIVLLCLTFIVNWLLTDTDEFKVYARQIKGDGIEVTVSVIKKGFFVDFGHAWSIGSIKESYEIKFMHLSQKLIWKGSGMPFILQQSNGRFYLATFDRESDATKPVFRCFEWSGDWMEIQQDIFPKNLAINNLLKPSTDEGIEYDNRLFRITLLAKFWFCITNKVPYWKVSDSMVKAEFITTYRASALDE